MDTKEINQHVQSLQVFGDTAASPEAKVKVAQDVTDNLETIVASPQYSTFLENVVPTFLKFLTETEPFFIAEFHAQQSRKIALEIIHRLPANELLRPHVRQILNACFKLLETDNEENVVICLRLIIELHKQYRPQYSVEVQNFLQFVKNVYKDLPSHIDKIFGESKLPSKIKDLSEINIGNILNEIYSVTPFQSDKKAADGTPISYSVIPRARNSLKVLQELPIIVVLMYQIYKPSVHTEVGEFIPIVMSTISLQPSQQHRSQPNFNKEILVDFMAAQIKTLSFLAYVIKIYQEIVAQHSTILISGLINLLTLCPMEVAHLRRELYIATRHIMNTELRFKFVSHMEKLFDEDILLGKGWTVNETMRSLAYSTLADVVHHVRQHLSFSDLSKAMMFFSCHVHDETLPLGIQTMSCKLLFNLVESIRLKSEAEGDGEGRDILIRMLDVLVYKFEKISQYIIPYFEVKYSTNNTCSKDPAQPSPSSDSQSTVPISSSQNSLATLPLSQPSQQQTRYKRDEPEFEPSRMMDEIERMDKSFPSKNEGNLYGMDEWKRFITPPSLSNVSFTETRQLVKTLVCAIKTISWGIASCKGPSNDANPTSGYKQFTPKETEVYLRLMKWGLKAVDIYVINGPNGNQLPTGPRVANAQGIRSKEEKEVLEHFAGAFTLLNTYTFRELFSVSIDMLVNRIQDNSALQVVANNLLANPSTSAVFATILVEYLLGKMGEMGEDPDKSNLYLRLFKLVFGSVSLFPAENEQMLKPHLREIVTQSMDLALKAKDPYNYFLLLRALFRSIGGGSHDLLYQEFLPLLPSLLQGLNNLQSGQHKPHMRDLFVELCLTVPVRLSSLLPYLPMLMDPLVSALNGSPTLVSQGLRTLELCVDNLQPEFLYEHIQPVRADLMQALWRTLRTANESSTVAFRILGKFGGSNRKMLVEPQKLEYGDKTNLGPCLNLYFHDHKSPVQLPLERVIECAVGVLRGSSPTTPYDSFYKRQAWGFIKIFLSSSLTLNFDQTTLEKYLTSPESPSTSENSSIQLFKNSDEKMRSVMGVAITGLILAGCVKELRREVYPFLIPFTRHLAIISVVQQTGIYSESSPHMDPNVFFDAAVSVLGNEDRETKKHVIFIISIFMNALINFQRSKEKACQLPVVEYFTEKVCNLCYERAWYTKLGGSYAICYFLDNMSIGWVLSHTCPILKAMSFVLTDLTGDVSSGTVDIAKENIRKMISLIVGCKDVEGGLLEEARKKSLTHITLDFIKQVTSPIKNIREQSMKGLEFLASSQGITVYELMEPHRDVLVDMVPPKKHLIRHQSIQSQLGLLDGNTFCLSLRPRLFSMDLSQMEHRVFVSELVALSEADDSGLSKLPCYKNVANLATVRVAVMRVLACTIVSGSSKEKVINIFLKGILNPNGLIQRSAFECLRKFLDENPMETEVGKITSAIRPILTQLSNMRTVTLPVLSQLGYMYQLFPSLHPEKLWEQLLQILSKAFELALAARSRTPNRNGQHELRLAVAVLSLFPLITPMQSKFLEPLCKICLKAESVLLLSSGCPLREPLMKFIAKQPGEYVKHVFSPNYLKIPEWNRFFLYFLQQKSEEGVKLREAVEGERERILSCINIKKERGGGILQGPNAASEWNELASIQYFGIKTMKILSDSNPDWLRLDMGDPNGIDPLIVALEGIWSDPEYHSKINQIQGTGGGLAFKLNVQTWKESQIICQLLLKYYEKNIDNLDLLFNLLRAFTSRTVVQFKGSFYFLKEFLEKTVSNYPVAWKRRVFFKFVEVFKDRSFPEEIKAKIIQCILIPCLSNCFDRGLGDEFIGSPPNPERENDINIVSVFLGQIMDPENPNTMPDSIRILLCQMSCVIVEHAAAHIHDAANKKQGNKLRKLMTFAWPCLLSKTCVDSSTKYYGHLLLSHVISKFAIHKRIVLQVFHSLLKASNPEAKAIVRQALEIITPALPLRMEDGNTMLIHWTKKILVEEGHSLPQLMHILQLIGRHWRVYYPVRHMLITHMVNSIQRLGFTATSTPDHKKLAVELAEVIIKWELERIRLEEYDDASFEAYEKKQKHSGSSLPDPNKPLEKLHTDSVVNFLLRMACSVNEANPNPGATGEILSKRCVSLIKMVIKPAVWPNCDLKLAWFDKLFATLESTQVNYPNICTAFELLTYLIDYFEKDQLLDQFKLLQKGLVLSMSSQNSKVIRAVHALLVKLMNVFPTEYPSTNATATKHDELEPLYINVSKIVIEGLTNYEKQTSVNPSSLFGSLMLLKAACTNNLCYIDRIITQFMKVLQKITKEHLSAGTDVVLTTDLLILGLDLVKNRVGVMGVEMRKAFIGNILVSLIEKSSDAKLMTAIIKMVEEWMKNRTPIVVNQGPSIREKSILLVKLMQNVEKRFSCDQDLLALFLELVNFIYKDEQLRSTELNSKLEPAFLAGLRCSQPGIRTKFFKVFDSSIRKKLHERLMYIMCSQNWEAMGPHYWIKQAEELLFSTVTESRLDLTPRETIFPSPLDGLSTIDTSIKGVGEKDGEVEMEVDSSLHHLWSELNTLSAYEDEDDEGMIQETVEKIENMFLDKGWDEPKTPISNIKNILAGQRDFQYSNMNYKLPHLVNHMIQLCHLDTVLAEKLWISFFPRAWKIFSERQQIALGGEVVPFLCSGIHVLQQNCSPSAINTFAEALCQCVPAISIKPTILYYLGKSHNLWHRMAILLEQMALDSHSSQQIKLRIKEIDCYEFEPGERLVNSPQVQQQETYDSLALLYTTLKEDDLWAGLWQKRAKYPETAIGVGYESQGFYEKAQASYEAAMLKSRAEFAQTSSPSSYVSEFKLWEDHWVKCSKELNQWETVQDYSSSKGGSDGILLLESIWRSPHWAIMKETLASVEGACPKDFVWKLNLYKGYLVLGSNDEQNLGMVERYVEAASSLCIKEWKKLPQLVSNIHVGILQAAQQIVELHEAMQIHQGMVHGRTNSLHETKAVVKTWRNRLPSISDDLSHWSDIFSWRQIHYQFIANQYESGSSGDQGGNQTMLGVHASAQAICHFGKIARKHNLPNVCLEALSKIYSIPSVPIVDCFAKIKQQVKCYIQQAQVLGRLELSEALEIVESTNLKYFSKEMTSEFFALKGLLLCQIGRTEEANKSFSSACQLNESLSKCWGFWGDYLEGTFTRDSRQMSIGVAAVTAFMHACRHQVETKARKYIAKILWLMMYDDEKGTLSDAVDKYSISVPPIQWLPWVPQLLTALVRHDGKMVLNLLNQVGRMYPQAVYFPIRTLYLTLKMEQREKSRSAELAAAAAVAAAASQAANAPPGVSPGGTKLEFEAAAVAGTGGGAETSKGASSPASAQPTASSSGVPTTTPSTPSGSTPTTSSTTTASTPASTSTPATTTTATGGNAPEQQAIKATPSMWRCSRIMHMQRDLHPTVLSSLEGIVDQIIWFRENWYEEVVRQLRIGLAKCYAIAFENRSSVIEATITPQLQNFVRKLVSTFGHGSQVVGNQGAASTTGTPTIEALLRRSTIQDPNFQHMKIHFTVDFDSSAPGALKLHNLIQKLRKWIKILEAKTKIFPKSFILEDRFKFLFNFSIQIAEIELPGEFLIPKHAHYYVKIARFQPKMEVVHKNNTSARRIYIRGHNGKIYPYLIVNDSGLSDARREERVLQMIRMCNLYLGRQKVTARRNLRFTVPKVVAVSPQMRMVEDNPSSQSLLEVFKYGCSKRSIEFDAAITRFYERIATAQAKGAQGVSHQVLREVLRDIQANIVPRTMLKEWALNNFTSPSDYWMFRKNFTLQLCLAGFAEYAFHLTRLNPEMMYLHQDSGLVNVAYFKFDIDDVSGELEANRPVPFRLTPNISEFLTTFGVNGPMVAGMISLARCLIFPNYKFQSILRAILRDEYICWLKKKQDDRDMLNTIASVGGGGGGGGGGSTTPSTSSTGLPRESSAAPVGPLVDTDSETVINMVGKAVNAIMLRIEALAKFEGSESKVSTLVAAANSHDNLCRMDPAWQPWL